ncbi:MAG: peptidylprolyl isomerase [Anaerolineae bacterium]|nr:peptidylprolyl isomerase [Anaerolineae bacterium]
MEIQDRTVVTMTYVLRLDDGEIVDSADQENPFQYVHGVGSIVPGLERGLVGMQPGDSRTVIVEPEEGYGHHIADAVIEVPLDLFPPDMEPEIGMGVYLQNVNGEVLPFFIVDLTPTTATLDANHPLAGKRLHFDVEILDVREASQEEINQGHVL